jgi:TusA-related sulfurtransferase/mannose-6-phosphate isomerase-like protein (cupin superfamily)
VVERNLAKQKRHTIIDSRGVWCPPTPLMALFKEWRRASFGDELEVWATEPTIESDIRAWAKKSGNRVIEVVKEEGYLKVVVRITRRGRMQVEESASKKNFGEPDEWKAFPKGGLQIVTLSGFTFGLRTLQRGWRWSTDMKPLAKTASCMTQHMGFVVSGRMAFAMDDGSQLDVGPGDAFEVHPGHDAWTVGEEPVVFIDLIGAVEYAKKENRR